MPIVLAGFTSQTLANRPEQRQGLERRRMLERVVPLCVRVDEGECFSVEHQARIRYSIQAITDDGCADPARGMDAELMGPTGSGEECDAGTTTGPIERLPLGEGGSAVDRIHDL